MKRSVHNKGRVLIKSCLVLIASALLTAIPAAHADTNGSEEARAWFSKGLEAGRNERYEEALDSFTRAVGIDPEYAEAMAYKGRVLSLLGRHGEALAAYERALEIEPDHALALAGASTAREEIERSGGEHVATALTPEEEQRRQQLQRVEQMLEGQNRILGQLLEKANPQEREYITERISHREERLSRQVRELMELANPAEVLRITSSMRRHEETLARRLDQLRGDPSPEEREYIMGDVRRGEEILDQQGIQMLGNIRRASVETMTVDLGGGVEMEFVWIPPGEYMRGSRLSAEELERIYGGEKSLYEREHPRHRVRLTKGFWLGRTPVTQTQWEAVMGTTLRAQRDQVNPEWSLWGEGDNYPMYFVSWNEAAEFAEKLSEQTEGTFRLPTEAEWEYACRAGTETEFYFGDDAGRLGEYAWYWRNSGDNPLTGEWNSAAIAANNCRTRPAGQKTPNAWGLYDMHGNVVEWCADWFGDYPSETLTDPAGPDTGEHRVLRGGAWFDYPRYCRSALRNRDTPGDRSAYYGFRIALDFP